jgi:hypothetical protein
MTGYFSGTVDFGGGPLTSAGGDNIFLAKFDASGTHLWSQGFRNQWGYSVALDSSGNVVMTGFFVDTVDFGGGPLTSAGGQDIFLAKFDTNGTHLWSQGFGDGSDQIGQSVAFDPSGNVVMTGSFWGNVDFGGGPLTCAGWSDIFLAMFDASGTHLWSQGFGDASIQFGRSVAFDPSGNVVMTGEFQGTVDFGGGPLTSAGWSDIFLAKFGGSVGVEETPSQSLPRAFALNQNIPNPFHRTTLIRYQISMENNIHLAIYDLTGRLVETLVNESQVSGVYGIEWEGKDQASGIYFYRLSTGDTTLTKKMILLR